MSGGHFNHDEFYMKDIIEKLQEEINPISIERIRKENLYSRSDDLLYGYREVGNNLYTRLSEEQIAIHKKLISLLDKTYSAVRIIDLIHSGDYGNDEYSDIEKCFKEIKDIL